MGLSNYTESIHLTARFIRLSSQRLLTRSNTTRHDQAIKWVYQATSQAIFPFGFVRILRKCVGITANIVSSSTELRTPSQDLSVLASLWPTHPTQGSIPFTATQSLGPYLPFQCLQGVHRRIVDPFRSVCEVPLFTRFIKQILGLFQS